MTADEFAAALRRLNLSQAALAREIDVHRMTIWKYAHGQLAIPKLLQRYIELRLKVGIERTNPPEEVSSCSSPRS